jgi:hypothetical protein
MTSQTDKLFRDKLENFQKPVPAEAWNRIEASLDKTTNKGLWMKIAAGLVLLAVATFLLWPSGDGSNADLLTNTPLPKSETESSEQTNTVIPESTPALPGNEPSEAKSKITATKKIKEVRKEEPVLVANNITEVVEENVTTINTEPTELVVAEVARVESTHVSTSKTIVYTADEVNAKFLKKELPVEATSDEKKSSSIQKLMGVAYNLKNYEAGLGDLRQKKDEILALNFRDKKQTQN